MRAIYIGQFGYPFSLTVAQWRTLCEGGARGDGYDLTEIGARELRRFPHGVLKFDRHSPGRSSIYNDLLYYEPLDWEPDQFAEALAELDAVLTAGRLAEPVTSAAEGQRVIT
jgi:hypothetical protein